MQKCSPDCYDVSNIKAAFSPEHFSYKMPVIQVRIAKLKNVKVTPSTIIKFWKTLLNKRLIKKRIFTEGASVDRAVVQFYTVMQVTASSVCKTIRYEAKTLVLMVTVQILRLAKVNVVHEYKISFVFIAKKRLSLRFFGL